MRCYKRIVAALMTLLLISTPITVYAAEANTPKEEVVYININQDGSVRDIYVVNIFDLDESGQIIDYGEYETLRNMTSSDEIGYSDSKVTIDTVAGKLYYEGKMNSNAMPWDISIRYYMDGIEYSAQEIAGRSGNLKITMAIKKNEECNSSFFEGYALQTTFILDTEKCKEIAAEGATIANVGSDKQLTYTILPNRETDIEILAKVKDFEMDGISINGVQLNLDIQVEDAELQEKIDEIISAINELNEGAESLYEGTSELYEGATELSDGASILSEGATKLQEATGTLDEKVDELHTGVGNLASGASNLNGGLSTLVSKNTELTNGAWSAYSALCMAAQIQINEELAANGLDAVTLTPENYSLVLIDILEKMDADAAYEQAYNAALQEVTAQVAAQAGELYKAYVQTQANEIYYQYVEAQAEIFYTHAASQIVLEQLITSGYTEEQAQGYLQTEEGQTVIAQTVANMTDEQKTQILNNVVAGLTDEQKQSILQGALESMTEEQKAQIRNAYIEQMMASEEVTKKIAEAVAEISTVAAKLAELKGQLDSYGIFYQGLLSYTAGVSEAAGGAGTLQSGLNTLHTNTEILKTSVGELNTATGELSEGATDLCDGAVELNNGAKELNDGAKELSEGTSEFVNETSGIDKEVSAEIDSLIALIAGNNTEVVSFVSELNTEIKAVQFVIKTDAIQIETLEVVDTEVEETLNFWQKLLRLFGLY